MGLTRALRPWVAYAACLLAAPLIWSSHWGLAVLGQCGIAIIACLSYNLLLGQGGMLSFGHAVYTGAGAYAAMYLLRWVNAGGLLPVTLIPLAAGGVSMAVAAVLGWLTTRRGATTFAMISLGLGEMVWAISLSLGGVFGGEAGLSADRTASSPLLGITWGPQWQMDYLIMVYTLLCTLALWAFTRSAFGVILRAVRDNPQRIAFLGYNPHQVRYRAFVVAAFFAGVAGGLASLNFEHVSTEAFSAQRAGSYLLFTVLGGTSHFYGPILGGVLMVLAQVGLSEFTRAWLLYVGLVFVMMVLYAPLGLAGIVRALVRAVHRGAWRSLWPSAMGVALSFIGAALGASVLIELTYQRQMLTTLGSTTHWLGLALDSNHTMPWVMGLAALGLGALAFWAARRAFRRRLGAVLQPIHMQETLV